MLNDSITDFTALESTLDRWQSQEEKRHQKPINGNGTPFIWDGDINTLPVKQSTKDLINGGAPEGQRSEAIQTAINALVYSGLDSGQIHSVFRSYPIGEKYRQQRTPEKWLQPQIDKAFSYVIDRATAGPPRNSFNRPSDRAKIDITDQIPLPLTRQTDKAEPYPLDALGPILGPAAKGLLNVVQAPDAVCAHSLLAFAAHTVQGLANLIIDGRKNPLNEFFLSVCDRSGRKSECDSVAGDAHRQYQKMLLQEYRQDLSAYADYKNAWDVSRKRIIDDKKMSLPEKNKKLDQLRMDEPQKPYEPIIVFSDATTEGTHKLYERGTPSKGLIADEGGQVSGGHGMRLENRLYFMTTFSKWWDAAPIDRIRGGDGSSVLYGRRLTIHLMMQSGVASDFFNDPQMRDQGLTSRLLVVFPEPLMGTRTYKPVDVRKTPEMQAYYNQVNHNLGLALPLRIDEKTGRELNELEPRNIHLSTRAKQLWVHAYEGIEQESGPGKAFESIRGFAGKAGAHILRLAGIMCLFENPSISEVTENHIQRATTLMEYYLNERLRITTLAEPNIQLENARKLLEWMQIRKFKRLVLPDVYQSGPAIFRNKKQALESLKVLEDHWWIQPIPEGCVSELTGKKSRTAWIVNNAKV